MFTKNFYTINFALLGFLTVLSHQTHARPVLAPKLNESAIARQYQNLRERIAEGNFSPTQLTAGVIALLEQLITLPQDILLEPNKKRAITYVIATTRRFLKDYKLFREDEEAAILMRKRFVDELLRALQQSDDLNESKSLVLEALAPHNET